MLNLAIFSPFLAISSHFPYLVGFGVFPYHIWAEKRSCADWRSQLCCKRRCIELKSRLVAPDQNHFFLLDCLQIRLRYIMPFFAVWYSSPPVPPLDLPKHLKKLPSNSILGSPLIFNYVLTFGMGKNHLKPYFLGFSLFSFLKIRGGCPCIA